MTKVGINGFGRIGRCFLRALLSGRNPKGASLEVVGINSLGSIEQLAHLLKYDSSFGPLDADVEASGDTLRVGNRCIRVTQERDPARLPWRELAVDVVIESTGVFTDAQQAQGHLEAGACKVIISAPARNEDLTLVYGVNHDRYDPDRHHIVSNASCTTNCLAPLVKVVNDTVGIESGIMTTIHAYTQDQNLQDGSHKDYRRGRSAATNIVPTSTGAAKAIGLVIPELNGRLDGYSARVPVATGSLVDINLVVSRETSVEEMNDVLREAAQGTLKEVLAYTDAPLVSTDIIGNPASSIFDSQLTKVIRGRNVKLVSWYDNEWGFANRLIDTADHIA